MNNGAKSPGPLRVLVMASTLPASLEDGTPRFVYDLAESVAAAGSRDGGAEVRLLAPHAPGTATAERWGRVEIERFRYFAPASLERLTSSAGFGMRERFAASTLAKLQVPGFFAAQAAATRRLVRRHAIDVVNAHWLVPQGVAAVAGLTGLPGVTLTLHVHAGDVYLLQKLPFGAAVARRVAGRCGAIVASGSHVRDTLDRLLGRPSGAVLQPMGVHTERFRQVGGATPVPEAAEFPDGYLVTVGRLVEKKGTRYLIEALPRLLERRPGLGLVVVGGGPLLGDLRERAAALGVAGAVRFVGARPHGDVVRYLRDARVAVVPSIIDSHGETEGMPTTVVEALAAGKPVVGSRVDGIPDVIRHGVNGWLVEEKDPAALADRIAAVLDDPASATVGPDAAAEFDWAAIGERYFRYLADARAKSSGGVGP